MTLRRPIVRAVLALMLACGAISSRQRVPEAGHGRQRPHRRRRDGRRRCPSGISSATRRRRASALTSSAGPYRRGLSTWQGCDTASIRFEFGGFTGAEPLDDDGMSTMGFRPDPIWIGRWPRLSFSSIRRPARFSSRTSSSTRRSSGRSRQAEAGRFDCSRSPRMSAGTFSVSATRRSAKRSCPSGGRRLLASGAVMFPIAFSAGNIVGRTLYRRRHRRRLGHLSRRDVSRRDRLAAGDGDQERQGRLRRARRRIQRARRARSSAGSRLMPRARSSSPASPPARTSSGWNPSTMVTWRVLRWDDAGRCRLSCRPSIETAGHRQRGRREPDDRP